MQDLVKELAITVKRKNITLLTLFYIIDKNKDGIIDRSEFKLLFVQNLFDIKSIDYQ